jgi:hypothetical protein
MAWKYGFTAPPQASVFRKAGRFFWHSKVGWIRQIEFFIFNLWTKPLKILIDF